jgi:dTDP-4-amino-4,6-dideoxygalactose transaminase
LALRRIQHDGYSRLLAGSPLRLPRPQAKDLSYNYAYFPVLLPDELAVLRSLSSLAQLDIHPRRYFYPSLNRVPYVNGRDCPISEQASKTVLCLPMSEQVTSVLQETIIDTLLRENRL